MADRRDAPRSADYWAGKKAALEATSNRPPVRSDGPNAYERNAQRGRDAWKQPGAVTKQDGPKPVKSPAGGAFGESVDLESFGEAAKVVQQAAGSDADEPNEARKRMEQRNRDAWKQPGARTAK